jgi:RimJ/RimL family protein N-acetyltransferase
MRAPGTIVSSVASDLGLVAFRYPRKGDAAALLDFINTISREQTFIAFQGEQLTLEQEEAWLRERLAGIAGETEVLLAAVAGDRVIGTTGVALKPLMERHVGVLGIALVADCRGLGIGGRLLEAVVAEASEQLAGLRIIELSVFATNAVARRLYERHGFVEYGRLPGGVLHRGQEVDHIRMYRRIGEPVAEERPGEARR